MKLESRSTLLARYDRAGLTSDLLEFGLSRGLFSRVPTTLPLTDDTPLWDEDKIVENLSKVSQILSAHLQRGTFGVRLADWLREAYDDPDDAYEGGLNPFSDVQAVHDAATAKVQVSKDGPTRIASPFLHRCYFKKSEVGLVLASHISHIWPTVRKNFLTSGASVDPSTGKRVVGTQHRLRSLCLSSPLFAKAEFRDDALVGFNIYPGLLDPNRYFTEDNIGWTYLEPSFEGIYRKRGRPAGSKLTDIKRREFADNLKKTREAKLNATVEEIMRNPKQITPEFVSTLPPKVRKALFDATLRNAQEEAA